MSVDPNSDNGYCQLGCPDISEDDYLNLIVKPNYLREKVLEVQATEIMTQVEQIHAQHILTTTKEGAEKLRERLLKGEDFTTLANTESKEQLDAIAQGQLPNGGDLGWFPREDSNLIETFVEGAWPVPAGQISQPVETTFGWHIIKVLERDPKRALAADLIEQKKTKKYDDWFAGVVSKSQISPQPTPTPAPPTAVVSEPTVPPVAASPQVTTTTTLTGTQTVPATVPAGGTPTTGAATTPGAGTPAAGTPTTGAVTSATTGAASTPVGTRTAAPGEVTSTRTTQGTATTGTTSTVGATRTAAGATPTP
jgi:hypothetical protein